MIFRSFCPAVRGSMATSARKLYQTGANVAPSASRTYRMAREASTTRGYARAIAIIAPWPVPMTTRGEKPAASRSTEATEERMSRRSCFTIRALTSPGHFGGERYSALPVPSSIGGA